MIKIIEHKPNIPLKEYVIGVVGDNGVATRQFEINRYIGDIDLSKYSATIELEPDGIAPFYDVLSKQVTDDKLILTWEVKKHDVCKAGKVKFNLWFGSNDSEERVYQTHPGTFECIRGIDAENQGEIIPPSIFEQAVIEATKQAGIAKEYAEEVLENGGYVDKPFYDAIMIEIDKNYDEMKEYVDKTAVGKDGTDGQDGEDGISCTHTWEGTTLIVTSAAGTSSADLKGEKGKDGYTPVKGVDYYTETDKEEIINAVLATLPNGDEVSY